MPNPMNPTPETTSNLSELRAEITRLDKVVPDYAWSNAAKALLAITDRLEGENEKRKWQPIETAPKDGTKLLGFWADPSYGHVIETFKFEWGGHCINGAHDEVIPPQYWMPLPNPPRIAQMEGGE